MCPSCGTNGANGTHDEVSQNGDAVPNGESGQHGQNGQNGQARHTNRGPAPRVRANPYQPVGDFLSNVGRFKIIESTLREGEQFANAFFDLETKIKMWVV